MKKSMTVLAAALAAVSVLSACGGKSASATTAAETGAAETAAETTAETETPAETKAYADIKIDVQTNDASVERDDGSEIISANYDTLVLSNADKYPKLAEAISAFNEAEKNALTKRVDAVTDAAKANAGDREDFDPYEISTEVEVTLADEQFVSLYIEEFTDTLGDHPETAVRGVTYDTVSGSTVKTSDIVADVDALPEYLDKAIHSEYDDVIASYSVDSIADALKKMGTDSIAWSLDKKGITFTFPEGSLAPVGDGDISVSVSRSDNPDFFKQ